MKTVSLLLIAGLSAASLSPGRGQTTDKAPAAAAATPAYVAQVFDVTKLHRIEVTVPESSLANFRSRNAARVHGTFKFDGTEVTDVGVRQQGGSYLPYASISGKPSLSIKFNEFVKGQDLFGLKKIVLKNQIQDLSLVNEHMTYEIFRRAGVPAPFTAYAQVTINGLDQGIYLLREPINQQFLVRNYGKGMGDGNLYEITLGADPARAPSMVDLKDEDEENRSRTDVWALASAISGAKPATFEHDLSPIVDIDRFITFFAAETATSASDGYCYYINNTYVYHHPKYGLVFIPHGADMAFWASIRRIFTPLQQPQGAVARGVLGSPELRKKYDAELARIGSDAVWNKTELLARVEQVARILADAEMTPRAVSEIRKFKSERALIEKFIKGSGTTHGSTYMLLP